MYLPMNNKKWIFLGVATLSLSGCGMFGGEGLIRDRSDDYLESQEAPPLVVPRRLDVGAIGQLYPIPPIPETNVLEVFDSVPRPQPLSLNNLEEVIKIQLLGGERWILSNRAPGEIWPRVRNILNRSGIPSAKAEATQGMLETVWLEFKGDAQNNHRYRFHIQPGVQVNSTEIKVLHDQVSKELKSKSDWPVSSSDDSREKGMIEILANALAGDVTSGTVSLLAQSIGGDEKVVFVTPKVADPYLLMKLDVDRGWASLAYSLSKSGFTTIDQNQSEGVFYVNYTPEEDEESGWFDKIFSRDDDELHINYLVKVQTAEDGIHIRVTDKEGHGIARDEAIKLLKQVRVNLS